MTPGLWLLLAAAVIIEGFVALGALDHRRIERQHGQTSDASAAGAVKAPPSISGHVRPDRTRARRGDPTTPKAPPLEGDTVDLHRELSPDEAARLWQLLGMSEEAGR